MTKKERYKPYVAVMLLLIKENEVLLQRRYNTGYGDGFYNPISGHIDANELAIPALIREAEEEAGLKIKAKDLKFVHVQQFIPDTNDSDYLYLYFECKKWKGTPVITEPEKHDDLSWFKLNKLPHTLIPYIKIAINLYKKNIFYSEIDRKKHPSWNRLLQK